MGGIVDGRYRVVERLARGGMSTVYLAVDERLDRQVALKVMHPHLAEDPVLVGRFEQEAKTAARLSHPHVVAVLDQGHTEAEDGDVLAYLVMEHVPGRTLRTVIRDRAPLSPREALRFLRPLVDGLAAAHRAGLVHRDVKPENVLVRDDGRVTVADFGLSRAATAHTMAGQAVVGTPAYLAPEHIAGAPADARSDVYAVGIILFELLTGRQPYTAATALQVAYRHVHERVPVPSTLHPGLPEELDDLVLWCTEPDPADRPAGADELLHRIDAVAAGLDPDEPGRRPVEGPGAEPAVAAPAADGPEDAAPDGNLQTRALDAGDHHATRVLPALAEVERGAAGCPTQPPLGAAPRMPVRRSGVEPERADRLRRARGGPPVAPARRRTGVDDLGHVRVEGGLSQGGERARRVVVAGVEGPGLQVSRGRVLEAIGGGGAHRRIRARALGGAAVRFVGAQARRHGVDAVQELAGAGGPVGRVRLGAPQHEVCLLYTSPSPRDRG